jgi:hypothetical protein
MRLSMSGITASMAKILENAATPEGQQKIAEALGNARQTACTVAAQVKEKTDAAAEATAQKVTEWTGRETTAAEVKRAAVVAGVAIAAVGAAACIGAALPNQPANGSGRNWGSDFESQMTGFMAESGGSFNAMSGQISY